MEKGWTYNRFYFGSGWEKRLYEDTEILLHGVTNVNEPNCKANAETFLLKLKKQDQVSHEPASFIEKYHPECIRGVQTVPKP